MSLNQRYLIGKKRKRPIGIGPLEKLKKEDVSVKDFVKIDKK